MTKLQIIQAKIKELKLYKEYLLKLNFFNDINEVKKDSIKVRKR